MTVASHQAQAARELSPAGTKPAKLAHFVLRTPNYDRLRAFYRTFLHAEAVFENDIVTFLRYDDEHHRLAIVNVPPLEIETGVKAGLEHICFSYETLGDLLGQYLFLKANGVAPSWCINHGMTTSIYYSDPDGNVIETQYDNMDVAAADAFMRGPYFAKNPIGVDFDPELLVERYRRGDPLDEIIRQGSALPAPDAVVPRLRTVPPYDDRGAML
jgi:catechol 2,3-dioxygenase-like lactoylglutathione lyase family enzyme